MSGNEAKLRDYLKRATADLRKARRRLGEMEEAAREPIAIVGMGCRYPGGASGPNGLWELLAEERDGIVDFPADRGWELERLYHPSPDNSLTSYVREGGFLSDATEFDAEFFGISPREARAMDPQQRLFLETCWEAVEDAGMDLHSLRGSSAGVFAGISSQDYEIPNETEMRALEGYVITGSLTSVVSGRIAYTLGLEGPTMTIDTACSSSLVALHLACRALRARECSLALAGGVTILASPNPFTEMSRQRGLAPDGRCKAFADAADGTGFSEGVGVLVVERLSDARRAGHQVLGVLRGSAVNQDGASNGLSAPNGPAQERVIRQALSDAGLAPGDVDAVEGHGTGTVLGDPIEASALLATYGQDRETPLRLGSLKSNIGHTQAAAGVAGVIKMVLAMREGVLPKTLHVDRPSSKIDWSAGRVELLTEPQPWESNGRPRRAAVSSFGVSGTNAHVILEEPPEPPSEEPGDQTDAESPDTDSGEVTPLPGLNPLVLSAKTEPALRAAASRLQLHLGRDPGLDSGDVAYSLATTRTSFEQRAVLLGEDDRQLGAALDALAEGGEAPGLVRGRAGFERRAVFVFPGHGSQWEGMATELLDASPVFAAHMQDCEEALAPHLDFSVLGVLEGADGSPSIERMEIAQPTLFAVMVSLAALWRSCGVEPAAVVGHSQGEIAAVHVAGGLSLADAARIVALRSKIFATLPEGGMVSVRLPAAELEARLESRDGGISIAALNGPASTIISGKRDALGQLLAQLEEEGVQFRDLAAQRAAHSPDVEPLREQVLDALSPISPRSGDVPFHSTVSGGLLDTGKLDADYWYRNLREPVLFEQSTRALLDEGRRIFMEVSPHPVFAFAIRETVEEALADPDEASVLTTLRRDDGGAGRFALSLSEAHVAGVDFDWHAFFKGRGAKQVPLPTYPFQRKRYWPEALSGTSDPTAVGQGSVEHPLLGAATVLAGGEQWLFTGRLSLQGHPWLADHAIGDTVLFPGTAFLELALRAGRQAGSPVVKELALQVPLVLPKQGALQLQVSLGDPDAEGSRQIAIHSRPEPGEEEGEWTCHAVGMLSTDVPGEPAALDQWPADGAEPLEVEDFYERLAELGFEYGPAFQGLTRAWRVGEEIHAEVALAEEQASEAERYGIHPALLDAALHGIVFSADESSQGLKLPFSWSDVFLHGQGSAELRVAISASEDGASLAIADAAGSPLATVGAISLRPLSAEQLQSSRRARQGLLAVEWQELSLPEPAEEAAESEQTIFRPGQPDPEADPATAAKAQAGEVLAAVQEWLASERGEEARFVLLTEGAVAIEGDEPVDLANASLWGLLRSAHSEHPGSFVLIDSDGSDASQAAIAAAMQAGEPEVALREGTALVPRAVRMAEPAEGEAVLLDPDKTVLVTGATGTLGSRLARHLVAEHRCKHLLLASRSGGEARGAEEMLGELRELGAQARIAACDVSDRAQLEALLDSVPEAHPLGAVFHAAGALDDGLIDSMSPERLERVFAPKADAAWSLHELTEDKELSAFVCFSSLVATLGGPGQSNYAAANAFLDALASRRRSQGLAATSIAWGYWASESGMTAGLSAADKARVERSGIGALADEEGLELFDAVLASGHGRPIAARLLPEGLRAQAKVGALHPLFRAMVRVTGTRSAAAGSLARKLAAVTEEEREGVALELVRTEVAAVLGHGSAEAIEPQRPFKELGFDSLAAVDLRNRLSALSGLRLAATVVFDYPTSAKLAAYLLAEATASGAATAATRRRDAGDEPIAIIGMACRYPGAANDPSQFWQLLAEGRDGIEGFPTDRGWDLERLFDPDPDNPGTSYADEGGFLRDAAEFDAEFFGIGPREAIATDPQQRLLLESCWEALESAGITPSSLAGSQTGVFAGVMNPDYWMSLRSIPAEIEGYLTTGLANSVASGRVAYALGLEGPAMTVDTACSSSLVAMHLAAGALRGGECDLALAGGVTVLSTPSLFTGFSRQRGLAPDGRCKSFAEAATGTGLAEGVGTLALARLSDAEREGHPILAVLRGSAVNQDGASNGLTAPNGPSQERVIRQALANARLTPQDIDAVEAHGTGTTLGDPIEAGALLATYGQDREEPLLLGSIKSNIGHTQAAAGVAGVIKMVLALREETLPKTLHVDAPSSKVDWEQGSIELLTEPKPWKPNGKPRRAAVSSFGISGTNAHVVLEEAPAPQTQEEVGEAPVKPLPTVPLAISAKTEPALQAAASRLHARLKDSSNPDPTDLAYSLATTRSLFEHRAVALGGDTEELLSSLKALSEGTESPLATRAKATPGKTAFLFSGQGAQRASAGKELYEQEPLFKEALDQICEQIDPHLDQPLKEILFADPGSKQAELLDQTQYTQPALFALEVALYRLLESKGLSPDLLAGHSVGEITAAHIAGVFDLPGACKLVCSRGALMGALPKGGAMLAVGATEAEAESYLNGNDQELSIAAINSPTSTVLSGTEEAIEQAQAHFEERGKKTKRLAVSHAFHSQLIEPMLEEFAEVAGSLTYAEPRIPVVSNTTGELLDPAQATDPAYWVSHVREAVRFSDSIETLKDQGASVFVEIGPEAALCPMAAETLEAKELQGATVPTLREGRDETEAVALSLASAHVHGAKLDWQTFFKGTGARRVSLPTYPFQRKRYWLEGSASAGDPASIGQVSAEHPLLAASIESPDSESLTLTGQISLQSHPWLKDHAIGETVLLPGTAFLELALNAAEATGASQIGELTLQAPLILLEQGSVALQVAVSAPDGRGERQIAIHSRPQGTEDQEEGGWTCHATGTLSSESALAPEPLEQWPPQGAEPLETEELYERLADAGIEYGPTFQGLTAAWRAGEEIYAEVSLGEEQRDQAGRYGVHPALLDAALHATAFSAAQSDSPQLPFSWQGFALHGSGASELRVRLSAKGEDAISLQITDPQGAPLASVESLALRELSPEQLQSASRAKQGLLEIQWQELSLPDAKAELPESLTVYRPGATDPEADTATAARQATEQALAAIQAWLAEERPEDARFLVLTEGAIAAREGESPDLAQAPLWGLLRSAQSEHPGSFVLVDSDGTEASEEVFAAALATEEPQIALREGRGEVPRLLRVGSGEEGQVASIDPNSTILITGATGTLGSLLARHLVTEHGARHLLLASRSGIEAKGARELVDELTELGAKAKLSACDVSDKEQLKALLDSIPKSRPLGAVFHAAGTVDDGLIASMGGERVERVFAPKVDAAWNLHELTRDAELSAFVCFSSLSATLGGPAQSNYAAANVFLDALASQRRSQGLAAISIAWGNWASESGMTAGLSAGDRARMERSGIGALSDQEGLELFDAALAAGQTQPIAARLLPAGLRAQAKAGALHPLLAGIVRVGGTRQVAADSLAKKLAGVPAEQRERTALELVRAEVATVLGHSGGQAIDPERSFKELGFDSLAAVELRNRLRVITGLRLPATLVFDYPTTAVLAGYLLGQIGDGDEASAEAELDRFERTLGALPAGDPSRIKLAAHLRALAGDLEGDGKSDDGPLDAGLESVSDDELLEFIDRQVGSGDPS